MGALFMKQEREAAQNSAAYKSRTQPTQYLVSVRLDGREPEEILEHEGIVYDRTDHSEFDLDSVPDHVRDRLAAATLELVSDIKSQPGGITRLEARTGARKARKI